jgi:hypothetical protein
MSSPSYHHCCPHYTSTCNCNICHTLYAQCPTQDLCAAWVTSQLEQGNTFNFIDDYEDYIQDSSPGVCTINISNNAMEKSNIRPTEMGVIHYAHRQNNNTPSPTIHPNSEFRQTSPQQQIQDCENLIEDIHNLSTVPEPMARYISHLQIFCLQQEKRNIIIHLTNTSSRAVRQQLFTQLIRILNLKPMYLVIQEETEKSPFQNYYTNEIGLLLTALLESRPKKEHLLAEDQTTKIWTAETSLLLSHVRPQIPQTPLQQMIPQTPITTISSIPSSSTKPDVQKRPNLRNLRPWRPLPSHLYHKTYKQRSKSTQHHPSIS